MDVQLADGRTVSIDTDDPQVAAAAAHKFQTGNPQRGSLMDFLASIPRGVVSGFSNAASASGQAAQIEMGQPVDVPSPQETAKHIEQNITGDLPQPQGRAGQFGAKIGEAVGNPASYVGPGGLALKLGTAVTGAVGSEGARQATEGTKYEGAAETAGGIVGGGVGGIRRGAAIPTSEELRAAGRTGYRQAGNLALEVEGQGVSRVATALRSDLERDGINAELAPKTSRLVERLQNPPAGAFATVNDFETARKTLGNITRDSRDPLSGRYTTEGVAAIRARQHLADYLENVPAADIRAGSPQVAEQASNIIREANANYGAGARAEVLGAKLERAAVRSAAANSGQNVANSTRQRVADILLTPKLQRGWNPDELAQANRVVEGTNTGNAARRIANLLGAGGGAGQLLTAGVGGGLGEYIDNHRGGAIGAIGFPALGILAKGVHNRSAARQTQLLDEMLRTRSPLAQSRAQPADHRAVAAALRAALVSHSP